MTVRFKARGSDGRVAIWRDATDEAPFNAPLDNLTRVLFHSDLQYPTVVETRTGTLALPSRGADTSTSVTHTLFAHGKGVPPFVLGYCEVGGVRVPFAGSVPVQFNVSGWARWLSLGANSTSVIIHELTFTPLHAGFAAIDVPWTVYVTDTLLS